MNSNFRGPMDEERGVEPTVMKILVGIILVTIGLGVGVTVYRKFGDSTTSYLDYSVSVSPEMDTITPGETGTYSVEVRTNVNFEGDVSLDVSGVPDGVESEFRPSKGIPTFGSTLEISANSVSEEQLGKHTITVRASSEDTEKTDTVDLTIEGD